MTILVTGGMGFIGSAVVRQYFGQTEMTVVNLDKLLSKLHAPDDMLAKAA
jgi:dTDP-D-glucose 4,6-dehydratase